MPHCDELFPTRFISAGDLKKLGTADRAFVVKQVVKETAVDPKTRKEGELWVVYFQGCKKGHRVRKSHLKKMQKQLGDTTESWIGKTATLVPTKTQVGDGVEMQAKREYAHASRPHNPEVDGDLPKDEPCGDLEGGAE